VSEFEPQNRFGGGCELIDLRAARLKKARPKVMGRACRSSSSIAMMILSHVSAPSRSPRAHLGRQAQRLEDGILTVKHRAMCRGNVRSAVKRRQHWNMLTALLVLFNRSSLEGGRPMKFRATLRRAAVVIVVIALSGCGTLIGAGAGGYVGNQFGKGSGKGAATAGGVIGGAVLGHALTGD
jgi:hypothetical protein